MAAISGTISIVQLTDLQMAKVFEVKAASQGKFSVQLHVPPGQTVAVPTQASLIWGGPEGLEAAYNAAKEILKIA
jgi:hypothetical protein